MTTHRVEHQPRDDALAALLGPWLPGRRWFPVAAADAHVTAVGGLTLADPRGGREDEHGADPEDAGAAEVRLLLLRAVARSDGTTTVLQVPLVLLPPRPTGPPSGTGTPDLVGTLPDGTRVLDGVGRPAFLRAWLAAADTDAPRTAARPTTPAVDAAVEQARVLTGEQSNTSVVLPGAGPDGTATVLKVFRGLTDGDNPDVDVPLALARAGWSHVPRPLAWLSATWPAPTDRTPAHGHLGVLSAFVPDARDGFELACALAGDGTSFAALADELGRVIGQLHRALAAALPVPGTPTTAATDVPAPDPGPPGPPATTVAHALTERFAWAALSVPALRAYAPAVAALAERTAGLRALPARQRVHGDLHLGQVLHGACSWYVLDFEGEPLRPIAERTRPDLALRDVAGMLRSFDYAAAVGGADPAWTADAREAFLRGYAAESPTIDPGLRDHLLRVLELDKALYEVVYESRNRPTWTAIPLAAVDRLVR